MANSSRYATVLPVACAAVGGVVVGALGMMAARRSQSENVKPRGQSRFFVGVDIGGTTITVGVTDDEGILHGDVTSDALGDDHTPAMIAERIAGMVHKTLVSASLPLNAISGVGVCSPGLLDFDRGVVKVAVNLKGWKDVPITALVADALGVNRSLVILEHDANTALLAEVWIGAAKGKRDVVLLTLGTGIGAGVMCGGRLLRGAKGEAGELGHAIVVPDGRTHGSAGVKGILEGYSSATSVKLRASEGTPKTSALYGQKELTCKDVWGEAARGDAFAKGVVNEATKYLAVACINCCRFYDPETILFTGGMAQAGEQLLSALREQFEIYHWNIAPVTLQLEVAAAPTHAGLIGAAYAAREAVTKRN